tara:strand:+ start:461 stop:751 length:291 start_codon:yes stop_codon:yes gene_type:complete
MDYPKAMEVAIVEESKNKLIFEVDENVGFLNAVKTELLNDKQVKIATYFVKHPLVGKPRMIIETDGADPKKALASAASRLKKENDSFASSVKKALK